MHPCVDALGVQEYMIAQGNLKNGNAFNVFFLKFRVTAKTLAHKVVGCSAHVHTLVPCVSEVHLFRAKPSFTEVTMTNAEMTRRTGGDSQLFSYIRFMLHPDTEESHFQA